MKDLELRCLDGTHSIGIQDIGDDEFCVNFYANLFYDRQSTFFGGLWCKIKFIFSIITKGHYKFFDIVLTKNELKDFANTIYKSTGESK